MNKINRFETDTASVADNDVTFGQNTVVVVDDLMTNCQVIKYMLEQKQGISCKTFTNPVEALAYVLENHPSMVITDHIMPQMSGVELIRELRKHFGKMDLPVIMITSVEQDQDLISDMYDAGGSDFLNKPVDFKELLSHVQAQMH